MVGQNEVASIARPAHLSQTWWSGLAVFLVVGYLGIGKPFAYLGLPWFSVYVSEVALGSFLLFGPKTNRGSWLTLVRRVAPLKRLERVMLLVLFYGAFEAFRGSLHGYPTFTALRDTAFNYYPLFLFLGIWVGLRDRTFFQRVVRMLAIWAALYGLAWIVFLNRIPWTIPGTDGKVLLFLDPQGGSAIALLGLVAFEPQLSKVWHLILLNAFVLLGIQSRAEWLGVAAGVLVFVWITGKIKRFAVAGALIVALLGLMYVTGLDLTSPRGRGDKVGTTISAGSLVARVIAPLDKDRAEDISSSADVGFAEETMAWRLVWWANIWVEIHARLSSALIGFGYGYPIGDLNPDIDAGTFIQTPHNAFLYALVYSGWVGVALFVLLQVELFRLLWRGFQVTHQPFGLMCWAAFLTISLFGDFFEAPFGAIPFYLLVGVSIAPGLLAHRRETRSAVLVPPSTSPEAQGA